MAVPIDPGTGIQDNNNEPIKVGGVTGLHARFAPLYAMFDEGIGTDNFTTALQNLLTQIQADIAQNESDIAALEGGGGSIIPIGFLGAHWDANGLGTIDTDFWAYCDGSTIADAGSPYNSVTLPDMSNRYLVGFGTEGGGDVDTAAWATAAVGNASHQINLQHSHTVSSHTHDLGNHTHTGGSHTLTISEMPAHTHDVIFYTAAGAVSQQVTGESGGNGGDFLAGDAAQSTGGGSSHNHGTTSTPSTNTSGSATPGTNNQLSTTQSIQPRSIRVRWIIRYK